MHTFATTIRTRLHRQQIDIAHYARIGSAINPSGAEFENSLAGRTIASTSTK